MKGTWFWPADSKSQEKTVRKIRDEDQLSKIIVAISKSPDGLSNAQIDNILANNSQWRTLWHLKELMSMNLVQYNVQFFGEAGRYVLTDLGRELLSRITGQTTQSRAMAH